MDIDAPSSIIANLSTFFDVNFRPLANVFVGFQIAFITMPMNSAITDAPMYEPIVTAPCTFSPT